jgi:hypothetical protein
MTREERIRQLGYWLIGLADLAEKYRLLAALSDGAPVRTASRRIAMREISRRFPAALREFDQTSPSDRARRADAIDQRIRLLLSDVDAGRGLPELLDPIHRWLIAAADFHAYLRELLKLKRWLGRRSPADVQDSLPDWYADCANPRWPLEHWSRARLDQIDHPPHGRLAEVAYAEIAGWHGLDARALRDALHEGADETREDEVDE